jgi:hypothetical protein
MSPTGKQDLDEALASPGALEKQLGNWERRQRVKARIHAVSALAFFTGMSVALWLFFEEPSKSTEAASAAAAFALVGVFQGILALSSRAQGRATRRCRETLEVKDKNPT